MRSGYENVYVIGTCLPSTNYTNEQYLTAVDNVREYFDKYSSDRACVVAGDLNADIHRQDLRKSYKSRTLLDKLFKQRRLVSSSCISYRLHSQNVPLDLKTMPIDPQLTTFVFLNTCADAY